jgi:Dyp-type peroxidase family
MGVSSVAAPSWSLAGPVATDTQGFAASPFAHLPVAVALFIDAGKGQPGWLPALRRIVPITDAGGRQESRSATIAFTATGLAGLGLDEATLRGSFERPFWEGMHHPDRRRRLGDLPAKDGQATLIESGPRWSGNPQHGDPTPVTVHALLVLYTADKADGDTWRRDVEAVLQAQGVAIAHELALSLRFDMNGVAREHFGFADGVSQPIPFGDAVQRRDPGPQPDPWHGVPLGDFLFGYLNAHNEPAPGPVVPGRHATNGGFFDLGRNGSYLIVRELHQNVAAFWASMQQAAAVLGDPEKDGRWIAERVVGREMDGDLLLPEGRTLPSVPYPPHGPDNAFGFHATDPHGFGCPIGSHVRRANPRDGLAPNDASATDLLKAANNHRLLRRGRKFGDDFPASGQDDGKIRGLLFMALNTDITRQFEFVQQTWILNRAFATLQGETDPLCGPAGVFTVPNDPLRQRLKVETFIRFAGGEYFFLPSLTALDWLEAQQ